ncbi:hypothetical protein CJ010_16615 [Azoarcus sp. DD4]|uniref:dioxygenase family protein n=1 Tax=Azoarcus sp. DD4 TaxID=2027405 RepID=UPI0011282799|nr:hypothetical protein [Azoarcus sp. DD4]QDF98040.1 hypothetical protein CJ010_16615 [Azoarcus sp. DD4]
MTDRRTLLAAGAGLLLGGLPARALARSAALNCGPTGSATAGPFYVANSPSTMEINLLRAAGTPLRVSGRVLGGRNGDSALAGARIELWHADAEGRYHPEDNGDISAYRPDEINLRGQVVADAEGRFAFTSIVPGHYGNRRRHLHWRLVADGHRALVTQTYWLDERGGSMERSDPVDRNPEDCRWLDFRRADGGVTGEVVFVLRPLA